jgi:hypothetical protein
MTLSSLNENLSESNPEQASQPLNRQEIGGQLPPQDRRKAKRQRIDEYEAFALDKEDHLEANLACLNAGLMRVGSRVEEALERTMDQSPLSADRVQTLMPMLDAQLRIARQIERYAHLERQIGQTSKQKLLQRFSSDPASPPSESEKQAS